MNGTILKAQERDEKGSKVRKKGFVPGIIYGAGLKESQPVKFESDVIKAYLKKIPGRKVQVSLGKDTKTGFIREIQRNPLSGEITHVDIQVAGLNDNVKMKLPIIYEGRDHLEARNLLIEVLVSEVSVYGMEKDIPEDIIIDVRNRKANDVIKVSEISIGDKVKLLNESEDEVLAIIKEVWNTNIDIKEKPVSEEPVVTA